MSQKHKSSGGDPVQAPARGKAEIMRRLADAIDELLRNPITVRMNEIWYAVECEAERKQIPPDEVKKYDAEVGKYEKAKARRNELKEAFHEARLLLQEDEEVFLNRTIHSMPDFYTYAGAKGDYLEREKLDKMGEIASRLQFRADTELASSAQESYTNPTEWEFVNIEDTERRKAGSHMVSRKQLAEQMRHDPNDHSFRQLIEDYPERRFYPAKKIHSLRKEKQADQRLSAEARYDMTDWNNHWHPPGAPSWRHPGKESAKNKVK